jgi:hypothetical protein
MKRTTGALVTTSAPVFFTAKTGITLPEKINSHPNSDAVNDHFLPHKPFNSIKETKVHENIQFANVPICRNDIGKLANYLEIICVLF